MTRFLPLLGALALCGCGPQEPAYTDHSNDPAEYARDVKTLALNAVIAAKRAGQPADPLRPLVTELEDQDRNNRPVGDFGPAYRELVGIARPLLDDCEKADGRPPDLAARLGRIQTVAETLPGEVQLETGGR